MSTSLGRSRAPWFVRFSWIPMVFTSVVLTVLASGGALLVGEALHVVSPSGSSRKLHAACDRVVERVLTTHDPVELE